MCNMCTRDVTVAPVVETPKSNGIGHPKEIKINKSLERMKKKHNITTDPTDEMKQKEVEYQPDLLAVSTQLTKKGYDLAKMGYAWFKTTKAHTVLTRTTQPFHVALATVVLLVWLSRSGSLSSVRVWNALYVISVATHLGAQIWMTLVSGIVLYFNLPRHEFGRVQTVLFPTYYAFNAGVSLLAMLSYAKIQFLTQFKQSSYVQLSLLLAVFCIEAYVRLAMVKPMLRSKHMKTQMEEAAGGGQEIGTHILGELAHCPRYLKVLRRFRTLHSTIAMGTMITLGCSLYSTIIIVDSMC